MLQAVKDGMLTPTNASMVFMAILQGKKEEEAYGFGEFWYTEDYWMQEKVAQLYYLS
jgi:hypothetical protein